MRKLSDAQLVRDAHAALLELERSGLLASRQSELEARMAEMEAQLAELTERRARRQLRLVGGRTRR